MGKKILLTGVTGLIGKEVIKPLFDMGYEVSALTIDETNPNNGVNWIKCNLFDEKSVKEAVEKVKPTHLLNFAWATTGDYLTNPINFEFVKAGLNLIRYFKEFGGKRAVYVGTCFEYKFMDEPLKEYGERNPQTLYAKCKDALHYMVEEYCRLNEISFGYGRIYYVFGRKENEKRLMAHIIKSLREDKEVNIVNGDFVRDYMYAKDIAGAFAKFVDSKVEGSVNICTGKGISLKEIAMTIAKKLGKENLVNINYENLNQPMFIVGDDSRLKNEVGYKIQYDFGKAIDEILKD
ncbi:NAD-dependent epimerase/dehydratase family protein [bacterium]|nr:NAD-dependent epimerase/dehydratase family protein [bacterium]